MPVAGFIGRASESYGGSSVQCSTADYSIESKSLICRRSRCDSACFAPSEVRWSGLTRSWAHQSCGHRSCSLNLNLAICQCQDATVEASRVCSAGTLWLHCWGCLAFARCRVGCVGHSCHCSGQLSCRHTVIVACNCFFTICRCRGDGSSQCCYSTSHSMEWCCDCWRLRPSYESSVSGQGSSSGPHPLPLPKCCSRKPISWMNASSCFVSLLHQWLDLKRNRYWNRLMTT